MNRTSNLFAPSMPLLPPSTKLIPGTAVPVFGSPLAPVWDFRSIVALGALKPSVLVYDWAALFPDAAWRLAVMELATVWLYPRRPELVRHPSPRLDPMKPHHLYEPVRELRSFAEFCAQRSVPFGAMDQATCDAYLLARSVTRRTSRDKIVGYLQELADLRSVLTASPLPEGFRPWGRTSAAQVAGTVLTPGENRTPWVPTEVLGPLLAGALFYVETAADDVLAGWAEHQRLGTFTPSVVDVEAALTSYVGKLRSQGRGLPLRSGAPVGGDPLERLNLSLLARQVGTSHNLCPSLRHASLRSPYYAGVRSLLQEALDELGFEEGGYDTPITGAAPSGLPWHERFGPASFQGTSARSELFNLFTACYVVVAALTGMRDSELKALRPGCVERVEHPGGDVRFRLRSRVTKGRSLEGDSETWWTVEPVVRAVRVLERLAAATGATGGLFTRASLGHEERQEQDVNLLHQLDSFRDHLNATSERTGLPSVPGVDGSPLHLHPAMFRRTLARLLARQPYGVVAGRIHLKHLSVVTSEGYYGSSGGGALRFFEEVGQEREEARRERLGALLQERSEGSPVAGRGVEDLDALLQAAPGFPGMALADDEVGRLVKRSKRPLYDLGTNLCWFDERNAICLARTRTSGDAPVTSACDPLGCKNSLVTLEQRPHWESRHARAVESATDLESPPLERVRSEVAAHQVRTQVLEPLSKQEEES